MKTYWGLLALAGTLAFLMLFLADQDRKAGVERLSDQKTLRHSAIESPDLCKEPWRIRQCVCGAGRCPPERYSFLCQM
jgi:hypothetical protein